MACNTLEGPLNCEKKHEMCLYGNSMDITLGIFKNTPTSLEMKDTNQGADLDRYFGPVVSSLEQIIVQV